MFKNPHLKGLPSSRTTRWHIPNLRSTYCIKYLSRVEDVSLGFNNDKLCHVTHEIHASNVTITIGKIY